MMKEMTGRPKRKLRCPYCGYETITRHIGVVTCGPHVGRDGSLSPAVPMREVTDE